MKRLQDFTFYVMMLGSLMLVNGCVLQDHKIQTPMRLSPSQGPPFASGLKAPIGITDDPKGNIWVTEAGTGTSNNGQVTVITPSGMAYPAITGFASSISPENSPEGLTHLLYMNGQLYILHGVEGKLYVVDITSFNPGTSAPIVASSLTGMDIGTFVKNAHPNAPDDKLSNPYNLTFGPNGDLFIVDAGANAIVRRDKTNGALSIYAVLPDVANPTSPMVGPPTLDAVPTGIAYDGSDFLVTTLTGFPFPTGHAHIYKVSGSGSAPSTPTLYRSGFSALTDLVFSPGGQLLVTEFGFGSAGRIASGEDAAVALYAPAITPVDILLSKTSPDTYYVLHYGPGLITKFTAQ
ncbi:hypothetical protein CLV98_103314 [Dyadobacter jejuensis]|uniref:ScyD/ScyE family protein n=1 Tax=Dyadobacter jejuensis TaxID=1082580 RepID=A0A316AN22_9BACT|nr:ScyD/ScyE family protein [Dyadobacter jejuensis]PWJ58942.1 hypothetical protein CLV98_103314 [Dyadobacter jejuensis]